MGMKGKSGVITVVPCMSRCARIIKMVLFECLHSVEQVGKLVAGRS